MLLDKLTSWHNGLAPETTIEEQMSRVNNWTEAEPMERVAGDANEWIGHTKRQIKQKLKTFWHKENYNFHIKNKSLFVFLLQESF